MLNPAFPVLSESGGVSPSLGRALSCCPGPGRWPALPAPGRGGLWGWIVDFPCRWAGNPDPRPGLLGWWWGRLAARGPRSKRQLEPGTAAPLGTLFLWPEPAACRRHGISLSGTALRRLACTPAGPGPWSPRCSAPMTCSLLLLGLFWGGYLGRQARSRRAIWMNLKPMPGRPAGQNCKAGGSDERRDSVEARRALLGVGLAAGRAGPARRRRRRAGSWSSASPKTLTEVRTPTYLGDRALGKRSIAGIQSALVPTCPGIGGAASCWRRFRPDGNRMLVNLRPPVSPPHLAGKGDCWHWITSCPWRWRHLSATDLARPDRESKASRSASPGIVTALGHQRMAQQRHCCDAAPHPPPPTPPSYSAPPPPVRQGGSRSAKRSNRTHGRYAPVSSPTVPTTPPSCWSRWYRWG